MIAGVSSATQALLELRELVLDPVRFCLDVLAALALADDPPLLRLAALALELPRRLRRWRRRLVAQVEHVAARAAAMLALLVGDQVDEEEKPKAL